MSRIQHEKMLDRDFFLSVFSASATKRDAKAYLSRYKQQEKVNSVPAKPSNEEYRVESERKERLQKSGVNLGRLYGQARAIEESPKFSQQPLPERYAPKTSGPTQVAVVKLRGIDELDEQTRKGVALTLAQLARLGLLSCVVIDGSARNTEQSWVDWRKATINQCYKLANAINAQSKTGARVLDQALGISARTKDIPSTVALNGEISVAMHENLLATLHRSFIPIIPPIAYTDGLQAQRIEADEAVLALTRALAGLSRPVDGGMPSSEASTSVDKIIVLDPLGGLPAVDKPDQSHIFINLEQEYQSVRNELSQLEQVCLSQQPDSYNESAQVNPAETARQAEQLEQHTKNLDLIKNCLTLLPPSSSALLTTPSEAASSALFSSTTPAASSSGPGVGTRMKRNPLIHNLLTDKPTVSSSLPTCRRTPFSDIVTPTAGTTKFTPATFFKRGMPLTIIPDPKISPWTPPGPEGSTLRLESDPHIDFPRLLHLIEDSFGRPLDVQHYLHRIRGRIAGIIVAGEYEGGAILTWESPTSSPGENRPVVPYLDKFAVLRKSQGSGGVADIVFNAMVRTCLPDGVVWRSRKNNPVNKWYFERSEGTWKLPESMWCMFWTGQDVDFGSKDGMSEQEKMERWNDYVNVCSNIEASWEDRDRKPPD
jgi:amino-acid N-acetyltransferase